jgi:trehalose 6-phosphate synthase
MTLMARLLVAIWASTLLIVGTFAVFSIREERNRLEEGLSRRAVLLGDALREAIEPLMRRGRSPALIRLLKKFDAPDRIVVVYDAVATPVAVVPEWMASTVGVVPEVTAALTQGAAGQGVRTVNGRKRYVYATPLQNEEIRSGALLVLIDAAHLSATEAALWQQHAFRFVALAFGLSMITILIVRVTVTRPLSKMAAWTKGLKIGQVTPPPDVDPALFQPLALEVAGLARSLYRAQHAAEEEARLRLAGEAVWTEERLKQFVQLRFGDRPLYVVSNREPLSHVRQGGEIVTQVPASGVVTAIEPVMRACGGVWVAHGSGDADRQTSDERGRLAVPPEDPRYTLRRVWLSREEEDGYYYGFANEGLWPLCHVVHARPLFRAEDWAYYRSVNEKFAAAVLEEMADVPAPMLLVQDYHFALLPALVKAERPDARVALFWHIPWPNYESFGICPWQEEILCGMLGADLVGFHTQYHCNNFLESVERALEARIDAEHFAVIRGDRVTSVKPFPISVAPKFVDEPPQIERKELLDQLGVSVDFLGVGVERVDYTKGLPERFLALQRFFERYPEYRGRMTFVQLAAPSRSRIKRYEEYRAEVEATVAAVNRTIGTRAWRPILYLERHHDRHDIWPFYRHADFCMVTSLHDGMNLVAKEFVSTRDDGDGALVLSKFTGAARELRGALLVNPYDLDATADAIRAAIEMPEAERRARMMQMRVVVREQNIFRWAGLLLGDLARLPEADAVASSGRWASGSA